MFYTYGLRGVLLTAADAAANTFQKTERKKENFFWSANQASYYGGIDRARNADSIPLENAFIFWKWSPLVPLQGAEGSSVSQHDLFFFLINGGFV